MKNPSPEEIRHLSVLLALHEQHPTWGRRKLARRAEAPIHLAKRVAERGFTWADLLPLMGNMTVGKLLDKQSTEEPPARPIDTQEGREALAITAGKLLRKSAIQPTTLANALGIDPSELPLVFPEIERMYSPIVNTGHLLMFQTAERGKIDVELLYNDGWFKFGVVADTHLASHHERLDALHATYDLFEREGITTVLHAGNLVDGYIPRINGGAVYCTSIDDQSFYVVDNYPVRDGITTHFITGNDHEGWWQKQGFNWGLYMQAVAERCGREDLQYIGHVESDVSFQVNGHTKICRVQHPGGGSAYARSYIGQKLVESFQGGEKPHILVMGHHHIQDYFVERNCHVVLAPGFQDQTIFGRTKKLRYEIGGTICRFQVDQEGAISRFGLERNMFFDRGFYKPFLRSDKRLNLHTPVFNGTDL